MEAKKKKGKKGKKGGKKGKKGKKKDNKDRLPDVDKTFYELQITDLNRRLARLRTLNVEYKEKNDELLQNNSSMEENRAEVVEYHKRITDETLAQLEEVTKRMELIVNEKQELVSAFQNRMEQSDNEYRMMQEQMTSEVKLLTGKLNSLEEFRIYRDDLIKKYEAQENLTQDMVKKHQREAYEQQRRFILAQDKLKKDMEIKLLQLANDFHDGAEMCIADTTRRVIRENIAVNNELDVMMSTQKKLYQEHAECKEQNRNLNTQMQLQVEDLGEMFRRCSIQTKLIASLTQEHDNMTSKLEAYVLVDKEAQETREVLRETKRSLDNALFKIRVLEQNIHIGQCENSTLAQQSQQLKSEKVNLLEIILHASLGIKALISMLSRIDKCKPLTPVQIEAQMHLLGNLLKLLQHAKDDNCIRVSSVATVKSLDAMYKRGDLGFVPVRSEHSIKELTSTSKEHVFSVKSKSVQLIKRRSTRLSGLKGSESGSLETGMGEEASMEEESCRDDFAAKVQYESLEHSSATDGDEETEGLEEETDYMDEEGEEEIEEESSGNGTRIRLEEEEDEIEDAKFNDII